MAPIIVALIFGLLLFVEITFVFNIFDITKRAKCMFIIWLLNLPFLILFCILFVHQNIFNNSVFISSLSLNLMLCVFFYAAGFFGGILQIYNLADRGFSLRILIDLNKRQYKSIDLDYIFENYSDGQGIKWMYQKRINDMLANGLINLSEDYVYNTAKGRKFAFLFMKLRGLYNFA